MAKRKAWKDLSPATRKRYLASGIGPKEHADKSVNLATARGHGVHTKSERRKAAIRATRLSENTLIARELKLGYFAPIAVRGFMNDLQKSRFAAVLAWQESRYNGKRQIVERPHTRYELENYRYTLPTLKDYVTENYGDEAWDSIFDDWWNEFGDLVMWGYYN